MSVDVEALVRALREHPAQRDELRAALGLDDPDVRGALLDLARAQRHTDEQVGALAGRIDGLAQAQSRTEQRLDELAQAQSRTEQRIDELAQAQSKTEQRLGELAQAQSKTEQRIDELAQAQLATEHRLASLIDQVAALVTQVSQFGIQVNALRGDALERRYREFGFAYLRAIARKLRLLTGPSLDDLLEAAVEEGRIDEDASDQVRLADAVFRGRRRADGAACYVVVEASVGIGLGDVTRARQRADVLGGTGVPTEAVVAGESISREAALAADDLGVWQVTNGRAVPPAQSPLRGNAS